MIHHRSFARAAPAAVFVALSLFPLEARADGGVEVLGLLAKFVGVVVTVSVLGSLLGSGTRRRSGVLRRVGQIFGVAAIGCGSVALYFAQMLRDGSGDNTIPWVFAAAAAVLFIIGILPFVTGRPKPAASRRPDDLRQEARAAETQATELGAAGRSSEARKAQAMADVLREEASELEAAQRKAGGAEK